MEEVLQQYGELLAEVDRWFAGCSGGFPDQIACAVGCASCCRGLFDITLLDAATLRSGFDLLPEVIRTKIWWKALARMEGIRTLWPEFDQPYLLNLRPQEEWSQIMPEEDVTPCVLLDDNGLCILYDSRPLTCRLHGLPLIDLSGEVMDESFCTLNFPDRDPKELVDLRGAFQGEFSRETLLIAEFTELITGTATAQLDTLIPAALLMEWGKKSLFVRPATL